jgi:hypothetical protein
LYLSETLLEGLAQHLQDVVSELLPFIQQEHAVVRQRHLPGDVRLGRIKLSKSKVASGRSLEVTALLHTHNKSASGVSVVFYDGDPQHGGKAFDVEGITYIGHPEPLLSGLLAHNAAHLIGFCIPLVHHHIAGTSVELDMEVIGSGLEAVRHHGHAPLEPDAHGPADPVQGDVLPAQACHEEALRLSHEALLSVQAKLPAAGLGLMMLLAGVHMPIPLDLYRATLWARLSPDHGSRLPSLYS